MRQTPFQALPLEKGSGLRLVGELDLATAPQLRDAFARLDAADGVVLDLEELAFIDSSGLLALTECARMLNGSGPLVLVNSSPTVRRVLEITSLDRHPGIDVRSDDDGR